MNPDMCSGCKVRFVLVPKLRRLSAGVPFAFFITGRENTLFGTAAFFIGTNSYDDTRIRCAV
jgi:hypothetical protein